MGLFTPSPEKKFEKAKKYYQQMKYSKAYELFGEVAGGTKGELHRQALFQLAEMNRKGLGTKEDHSMAARQYEALARQGNVEAMKQISLYYIHGQGVERRNFGEAFKWCRRAVDLGETQAKQAWEQFCDPTHKDPVTGWESTLDGIEDAFESFTPYVKHYPKNYDDFYPFVILCWLAAQDGSARAQRLLGDMFSLALSVRDDVEEAFYWYEKAAAQNDAQAYFCMGTIHERIMVDNEYTVERFDDVISDYRKAAELGHREAQEALKTLAPLRDACCEYEECWPGKDADELETAEKRFGQLREAYEAELAASGRLAKYDVWY